MSLRALQAATILLLVLAIVSVILVVAVVFLSGLTYMLFRHPPSVKTPITTLPTQATPKATFRSTRCPFQPGNGIVDGQTVKCGYVTVPRTVVTPMGLQCNWR